MQIVWLAWWLKVFCFVRKCRCMYNVWEVLSVVKELCLKQNKKIYNNMYLLLTKEVNLKGCTSDFGRRDFKKVLFIDIWFSFTVRMYYFTIRKNTHYTITRMHAHSVAQSCPILCDPMDCSPPDQAPLSMRFSRQEYWSGFAISFSIQSQEKANF